MQINDYEQLVLSACLIDSKAIVTLAPHLAPERFAKEEHKRIYNAILDVYGGSKGKKVVDVGSVSIALGHELETVGGLTYLTLLANKVRSVGIMSTQGLHSWADVVDQCGRLRHISLVASEYADKFNKLVASVEVATNVDSVIAEFLADIRKSQLKTSGGYEPIGKGVDEFQKRLQMAAKGEPTDLLSTGFLSIDTMLAGGLPRGGLVVLCGLSSDGKTSLAMQIAHNVAKMLRDKSVDGQVLVNSLEMKHWSLVKRLASAYGQVDTRLMTTGLITPESPEFKRLWEEAERIRGLPIKVDDYFQSSVSIQYHAAMELSQTPVKLIVIDFAELVKDEAKTEELRVSQIFNNAKQLAKDTEATVIILAQYNRTVDARPDMLGRRGDIRYSGMAEHVADLVMHIYNPAQRVLSGHQIVPPREMPIVWVEQMISAHAYVFADKNREGPVGTTSVLWTPKYTAFSDLPVSRVVRPNTQDEF